MRFLILTLLIFLSGAAHAESLSNRLLKAASDTASAEQVLNELQHHSTNKLTAEDYLVISEAYQTLSNREAALDAINKAESSATSPYLKARSIFSKAQIYGIFYQDAEMAIRQLETAEQLLLPLHSQADRLLLSDVLTSFASAYNVQGNLNRGLDYAKRSLDLARELESPSRELNALIMIGRMALQNNQYQQAFRHLQQSLVLATQLQDEEQLASIHFRLGMAYRKLDQHTQALIHFEQAGQRYLQLKRMPSYSYVLVYMAESYLEEPVQIDKAEELLQQALKIAEEHRNMTRAATVYYSLGRAAMLRHDFAASEAYYQKALQHFRQNNARSLLHETSLAIVQLLLQQQRYTEATTMLSELAAEMDNAATFLQLKYYRSAAQLAAAAGDWQQAYQLQEKVTTQNQLELKEQIQDSMDQLQEGLNNVSDAEQQQMQLVTLEQTLATTKANLWMMQLLLAGFIVTAFFAWQYARRKITPLTVTVLPAEPESRQWSAFKEKVRMSAQQPMSLVIVLPRLRAALQRQYGRRIVSELLLQVQQALPSNDLKAYYSGTDMLCLAVNTTDPAAAANIQQLAEQLLQHKLAALGAEPAVLSAELVLNDLLGSNWHKDDLNSLAEVAWFGWYLAEQSPPTTTLWRLEFAVSQPRPCEWQADNLRLDMLNAYQLQELQISVNQQPLLPAN